MSVEVRQVLLWCLDRYLCISFFFGDARGKMELRQVYLSWGLSTNIRFKYMQGKHATCTCNVFMWGLYVI